MSEITWYLSLLNSLYIMTSSYTHVAANRKISYVIAEQYSAMYISHFYSFLISITMLDTSSTPQLYGKELIFFIT